MPPRTRRNSVGPQPAAATAPFTGVHDTLCFICLDQKSDAETNGQWVHCPQCSATVHLPCLLKAAYVRTYGSVEQAFLHGGPWQFPPWSCPSGHRFTQVPSGFRSQVEKRQPSRFRSSWGALGELLVALLIPLAFYWAVMCENVPTNYFGYAGGMVWLPVLINDWDSRHFEGPWRRLFPSLFVAGLYLLLHCIVVWWSSHEWDAFVPIVTLATGFVVGYLSGIIPSRYGFGAFAFLCAAIAFRDAPPLFGWLTFVKALTGVQWLVLFGLASAAYAVATTTNGPVEYIVSIPPQRIQ
jgi:hypothetical protein